MHSNTRKFENQAAWLGYLGIVPFLIGAILQLNASYAPVALSGVHNYAAVILTFAGAIHWGRAMNTRDPKLLSVSTAPSLVAWCALFMTPGYALPLLIVSFLMLLIFDYRQYQDTVWFQRLRTHLTASVCGLLILNWVISL